MAEQSTELEPDCDAEPGKFLHEARIRDLRVGSGTVDLILRRHTHDVGVEVMRREGPVTVSIVK